MAPGFFLDNQLQNYLNHETKLMVISKAAVLFTRKTSFLPCQNRNCDVLGLAELEYVEHCSLTGKK